MHCQACLHAHKGFIGVRSLQYRKSKHSADMHINQVNRNTNNEDENNDIMTLYLRSDEMFDRFNVSVFLRDSLLQLHLTEVSTAFMHVFLNKSLASEKH